MRGRVCLVLRETADLVTCGCDRFGEVFDGDGVGVKQDGCLFAREVYFDFMHAWLVCQCLSDGGLALVAMHSFDFDQQELIASNIRSHVLPPDGTGSGRPRSPPLPRPLLSHGEAKTPSPLRRTTPAGADYFSCAAELFPPCDLQYRDGIEAGLLQTYTSEDYTAS